MSTVVPIQTPAPSTGHSSGFWITITGIGVTILAVPVVLLYIYKDNITTLQAPLKKLISDLISSDLNTVSSKINKEQESYAAATNSALENIRNKDALINTQLADLKGSDILINSQLAELKSKDYNIDTQITDIKSQLIEQKNSYSSDKTAAEAARQAMVPSCSVALCNNFMDSRVNTDYVDFSDSTAIAAVCAKCPSRWFKNKNTTSLDGKAWTTYTTKAQAWESIKLV